MNFNEVKTTAVVGAGNIGHGIALTLGLAGYEVRLNSTNDASLKRVWILSRQTWIGWSGWI